MRCESRQEAGNIMMVPVISVACRQFKMRNALFSCALACKCVGWGFNLQTRFTTYLWHTKLLSIRLELFISPKLVLKMSSIFSRNKLMIPIVLFQSLWMFFLWLVFTSNLISQTTWLKVKLKLVNLAEGFFMHTLEIQGSIQASKLYTLLSAWRYKWKYSLKL